MGKLVFPATLNGMDGLTVTALAWLSLWNDSNPTMKFRTSILL
jgi:hypothetical protein